MLMRPISFLTAVCLCVCMANGQILNGGFEEPDYSRATSTYIPPLEWFFEDIPDVRNEFYNFNYVNWQSVLQRPSLPQTWISKAFEGNYFVVLASGEPYQDRDNYHSTIEQLVTLEPGDVLCGAYFFGTTDYVPYNDTAFGKLIPVGQQVISKPSLNLDIDPQTGQLILCGGYYGCIPENDALHPNVGIELFRISVFDVGDYQSTTGWKTFKYVYTGQETATFRLFFQVRDSRDRFLSSYLALDNIRICKFALAYGDLNQDCTVNLTDFAVLAQAWMADCQSVSDPLSPQYNPAIPCSTADGNGDNLVNEWELFEMLDNWLYPNIGDPAPGE